MKYYSIKIIACLLLVVSCKNVNNKNEEVPKDSTQNQQADFKFSTWITADKNKSKEDYDIEFKKYKNGGIDDILINTNTDPELLKKLVTIAKENELKVHAWIMTMNRPGDSIALQHPDWYMVSRSGKSCFDDRPYVDYYQWLSPSHQEARAHIFNLLENLAKVDGIESVHLDYIRYPDVFLPIGLLPKYNLVQNEELPDFDFDYSEVAVEKFKRLHDKNIKEVEVPAIDMEWKQFRLNEIKAVVDGAYKIAHTQGKKLTAAVFPYPEMADHMVRQRWDKWNIDEVYPMIYHGFYNEEVDWIGYATKQGVEDLSAKGVKLNTGIYIPDFKTAEELGKAIKLAKENGAVGVSFFDGNGLTDEFLSEIKSVKESFKQDF